MAIKGVARANFAIVENKQYMHAAGVKTGQVGVLNKTDYQNFWRKLKVYFYALLCVLYSI